MANDNFIISTLNLSQDRIKSLDVSKQNGVLLIHIFLRPNYPVCPRCGAQTVIKEYRSHSFNHLPIAGIPSKIIWKRTRYKCSGCAATFSEDNPFGPEHFHQTYAVLDDIAKALHNIHYTFKDIALRYGVSASTVQLYADSFIRAPRLPLPENLGIDEIHSDMAKYGGSYLCVFVDNTNRNLNEILPDRSKRTLSRHLDSISLTERNRVKYVTIDMWEPYKDVSLKYFKNAEIAVDPFHVVEHLTACFSRLRIAIMNQCVYNSPEYYLLKTWHKLLDSDNFQLDNKPKYNKVFAQELNYRDILNLTLDISPDLRLAYELKERYRSFNQKCSFEEAPAQLDQLIEIFETADLECYREFVSLLKHWRTEIINSFHRPFDNRKQSNALAENINKNLKELFYISNGLSNFERFRARALYCLNGHLFYTLTKTLTSNKRIKKYHKTSEK